MMYWCLTFLRHTGLWEQMWETMRLNLILNLNLDKDSLSFKKTIDEKKLSKISYLTNPKYIFYILFIILLILSIYSWNGRSNIDVKITTKSIMAKNRIIKRELSLD